MPKSEGQCFEWHKSSNVKIPSENGKSAIFQSSRGQKILLVHADRFCRKGREDCGDGFFETEQQVADYIISKPGVVDVVVELKGTDVLMAVAQIEATIPSWRGHERCSGKIGALIVSGKGGNHPAVITKLLVKKDQFKKRGMELKHSTNPRPTFDFTEFA